MGHTVRKKNIFGEFLNTKRDKKKQQKNIFSLARKNTLFYDFRVVLRRELKIMHAQYVNHAAGGEFLITKDDT